MFNRSFRVIRKLLIGPLRELIIKIQYVFMRSSQHLLSFVDPTRQLNGSMLGKLELLHTLLSFGQLIPKLFRRRFQFGLVSVALLVLNQRLSNIKTRT